ncbi:MAG: class I SAM-dependent methyltransferase [Acidothermaceae bacterium]
MTDVQRRYDGDAAGYERWWAPVLHSAMQPLLESVAWSGVEVAVEIGCGTGGVLSDVRQRAPSAKMLGLDLSAGMLSRNKHRAHVARADAQALPLMTGSIDLIVCGFVMQHVSAPALTFGSVARVLRAGGGFALAAWIAPRGGWVTLGEQILNDELDRVGAPVQPDTRPGGAATDSPEKLEAFVSAAGLSIDAVSRQPLRWRPTVDDLVAQLTSMRSTGRRFAQLDERAAERVRAASLARLATLEQPLDPPHHICYVWAHKA